MPRATPVPLRDAILQQRARGQTASAIAEDLELPVRTVRHLLARFERRGVESVRPDYSRCGRTQPCGRIRSAALLLRQEHPQWGAGLIAVLLGQQFPEYPVPAPRTLRRWFAQAGLSPASNEGSGMVSEAASKAPTADAPHAIWQVDGVEELKLPDGALVCWMRCVDEHTGAVLGTVVFSRAPHGQRRSGAHLANVQTVFCPLRSAARPSR